MRHAARTALALAAVSLGACEGDPATILLPEGAALAAGGAREEIRVNMLDNCDPQTFNAAIGPGTCVRNGGVTFQKFIARLTRDQLVPSWHFSPGQFQAVVDQTIEAYNLGGEVHTFTHVASFGGGEVPILNTLSGNPTPAPECLALEPDDRVPPGGVYEEDVDQPGVQRFQCCIHPWMRAIAVVR